MIAWIMAMESEMEPARELMDNLQEKKAGTTSYYTGTIEGQELLVCCSGIGKVEAALAAQAVVLAEQPSALINLGLGGGIDRSLKVGDWLFSSACVQADYDTSALDGDEGYKPIIKADQELLSYAMDTAEKIGLSHQAGLVATQDLLLSREEDVKKLLNRLPQSAVAEMEGAAVAAVAQAYDLPFLIIRTISDLVFEEGNEIQFTVFKENHCQQLGEFVKAWYAGLNQ